MENKKVDIDELDTLKSLENQAKIFLNQCSEIKEKLKSKSGIS